MKNLDGPRFVVVKHFRSCAWRVKGEIDLFLRLATEESPSLPARAQRKHVQNT